MLGKQILRKIDNIYIVFIILFIMRLLAVFLLIGFIIVFGFFFVTGIKFLFFRASVMLHEKIPFSPLESEFSIANKDNCRDSDGGIFIQRKGIVSYEERFLFFKFKIDSIDRCLGKQLEEFYCSEKGRIVSSIVRCEEDCFEGACYS